MFTDKWNKKLAKSDNGLSYSQGKCISENEYGKGRYYNKYYDSDFNLMKTNESCGSKLSRKLSHIMTLYRTKSFI